MDTNLPTCKADGTVVKWYDRQSRNWIVQKLDAAVMATKKPAPKVPSHIIKRLREAREAATLANASFAFPNDTVVASRHMQSDFKGHPDDYIKETVRVHHQSWIIHPLDQVIAWAEGCPLP